MLTRLVMTKAGLILRILPLEFSAVKADLIGSFELAIAKYRQIESVLV